LGVFVVERSRYSSVFDFPNATLSFSIVTSGMVA
jgi:hypothetical protein